MGEINQGHSQHNMIKDKLNTAANEIIQNALSNKEPNKDDIFLGISGAEFDVDEYDFGNGIYLKKTYAFIFAPYLAAFKKPLEKGDPSPGPWKTVSGGQSRYITYELYIPLEFEKSEWFDRLNTAWWILSLLRLKASTLLIAPVSSNYSFSLIGELDLNANFLTIEFNNTQLPIKADLNKTITISDLDWVKQYWQSSGMLFRNEENFADAYKAADHSIHEKYSSLAMVTIWGALERLFADFKQELNYRVALNIATYLEDVGEKRLELFKSIKKLYTARSKAAHGSANEDYQEYTDSYLLLKNALIKMIEKNKVPSQADIERLIMCDR